MSKILLLVVENRDDIGLEYTKLLVDLAWNRLVSGVTFWGNQRRSIWYMRKTMIENALNSNKNFTHILFVDTDTIPPEGFIEKLSAHNVDMVSGYYCDTDGRPMTRKHGVSFLGKGLEEVDIFGMGCSLVKREVFEKVPYPEPTEPYKFDADVEWCKACQEAGYKIYVDFNLRASHLLVGMF